MNTEYEVLKDDGRSMQIKTKADGKVYDLKMPSFGARDEIQEVIEAIQKKGEPVKRVMDDISRKRKIKVDDVHQLMRDGKLNAEEEDAINTATANSKITGEHLEKIISFVLVIPEGEDKVKFVKSLDLDVGVAVCSAAMTFLPKCLSVGSEERKK